MSLTMRETILPIDGIYADEPERRFFSKEECQRLGQHLLSLARGGGETRVEIQSKWDAHLNWSRNAISLMSDQRSAIVYVIRTINGAEGVAATNQIDPVSLEAMVTAAEWVARANSSKSPTVKNMYLGNAPLNPHIWDDTTLRQSGTERGKIVGTLIGRAAAEGIVSAGYLQSGVRTRATLESRGDTMHYMARTVTQLSTTMRDWKQKGSGWAGRSSYAWSRIDPDAVATTAIEKCIQSRNPVAVEPGRYTTILEPQATGQLLQGIFDETSLLRYKHEGPSQNFWFEGPVETQYLGNTVAYGLSKIGQRVIDRKVTIRQIPMHPDLGTWPYQQYNDPYQEVTWIDQGVLVNLPSVRAYVSDLLNRSDGLRMNNTFIMEGGETSVQEMIASTRRGILMSRFSTTATGIWYEGYTRDGLWLIENGKISKAIKNFRVTDSPLFIFNDIEMIGASIPIFSPETPIVVPPVRVREVNFVSLADAV